MNERRRSQRVAIPDELFGKVKATVPARIVDLSRDGVQVEIPTALRPAVECDISVPTAEGDLRLRARVQRCRATSMKPNDGNGNRLVYRAGLQFVEVPAADLALLAETLQDIAGSPDNEPTAPMPAAAPLPGATAGAQEKPSKKAKRRGPVKIRLNSENIRRRTNKG